MCLYTVCVCTKRANSQTWGSPCLSCKIFSTRWGKLSSGAVGSRGARLSFPLLSSPARQSGNDSTVSVLIFTCSEELRDSRLLSLSHTSFTSFRWTAYVITSFRMWTTIQGKPEHFLLLWIVLRYIILYIMRYISLNTCWPFGITYSRTCFIDYMGKLDPAVWTSQ